MSEHTEQIRRVNDDGTTTTKTVRDVDDDAVVAQSETDDRVDGPTTAARIVMFITGIILVLLAFRFVLVLLGANQASPFAQFIYSLSYPFAAPFFGLFGYQLEYGVARLELSTLVAIAVYALVGYAIARLLTIRERSR